VNCRYGNSPIDSGIIGLMYAGMRFSVLFAHAKAIECATIFGKLGRTPR
jgi:hypothetical protein